MRREYSSMPHPKPDPTTVGQESVWDYPRPPRVEADSRRVVVEFAGAVIADSTSAFRVLETSHPPVFYIAPEDVKVEFLLASTKTSYCEFKGESRYYDIVVGDRVSESAAWCYPEPDSGFEQIQYAIAFYPGRVDKVTVDGEIVIPQPGEFYGGWITSEIAGPFKGEPGSGGW